MSRTACIRVAVERTNRGDIAALDIGATLAQASTYAPWDDRRVAEEAVTRGTDNWQWPDTLDAVAAAPAHHVVLLENEHVRVLEARIEAGDTVPLHTHR
jgi:hypothetical protein